MSCSVNTLSVTVMLVSSIAPPVIDTLLAFCDDILPVVTAATAAALDAAAVAELAAFVALEAAFVALEAALLACVAAVVADP